MFLSETRCRRQSEWRIKGPIGPKAGHKQPFHRITSERWDQVVRVGPGRMHGKLAEVWHLVIPLMYVSEA